MNDKDEEIRKNLRKNVGPMNKTIPSFLLNNPTFMEKINKRHSELLEIDSKKNQKVDKVNKIQLEHSIKEI